MAELYSCPELSLSRVQTHSPYLHTLLFSLFVQLHVYLFSSFAAISYVRENFRLVPFIFFSLPRSRSFHLSSLFLFLFDLALIFSHYFFSLSLSLTCTHTFSLSIFPQCKARVYFSFHNIQTHSRITYVRTTYKTDALACNQAHTFIYVIHTYTRARPT